MSITPPRKQPLVSVIVLNFNGERTLETVLLALKQQTYPNLEVIVVDNNSDDSSRDFLKKVAEEGKVTVIFSPKNLGFSAGNNLGLQAANGEFVALLNNDGVPAPSWINHLVATIQSNPQTAAVNSKLLLYPDFTRVSLELKKGQDENEVQSVRLIKSELLAVFSKESIELEWSETSNGKLEVELQLSPKGESHIKIEVSSRSKRGVFDTEIHEVSLKNAVTYQKIQNAGVIVFPSGYGRDRGALVRASRQYYEVDTDQFVDGTEVYAVCAGACLYRRSVLEKVGFFDEQFFLYYEDVELSERLRLSGYLCRYSANAVVRHLHAASSKEGSDFFTFHAERGRLLHLILHFPLKTVIQEMGIFSLLAARNLLRRKIILIQVLISLLKHSPLLFVKRWRYKQHFSPQQRVIWLAGLQSGRWLFGKNQ